jgi:DNA end-binding protein Ku
MARALWKGAISFGLVTIPVSLHTAVRDGPLRFRLLHAKDRSPIKNQRICQREGQPVSWDNVVKGYEYEKGRFVLLTQADFEAAALEKSDTIDILSFVDEGEIDDRFFETSYYLLPGKGGDRAYALLREAIKKSGKIGIAKIILRHTQHLAALSVVGNALVLTMMRLADEVIEPSQYELPGPKEVRPKELQMAESLIENFAGAWDPAKYTDDYRANLMRVIQAKLKGKKPELPVEVRRPEAEVVDLMDRLRRSLRPSRNAQPARPRRHEGTPGKKKKTASRVA